MKMHLEFYAKLIFNSICAYIALLDTVDLWVRTVAGIAALILTILLAIQAYHNIKSIRLSHEEKRVKIAKEKELARIEVELKQQELAQLIEKNKNTR